MTIRELLNISDTAIFLILLGVVGGMILAFPVGIIVVIIRMVWP